MQRRPSMLSAFRLSTAMFFGTVAMAADLPKEGTFSCTYYGFGTSKATKVGEERLLVVFDENGLTLSNGFLDHMSWHCWGWTDFRSGIGQSQGIRVGTDRAGNQLVVDFAPGEKHATNQTSWNNPGTFTTGTGQFAGVSGGFSNVIHTDFRPLVEGTYHDVNNCQGTYKLP